MLGAAGDAPPVSRAKDAADEIALAVAHMQISRGVSELHLVAHSWGTIPAATYASRHMAKLKSLTLFGPVVPVASPAEEGSHGAWFSMTAQQRLAQLRFTDVVPRDKHLLETAVEQRWAAAFAASSPHLPGDAPDLIRIPEGPNVDLAAAMRGVYPYNAADIDVPVFVVYGNYDVVVDDAGASSFLARFTASPMKWRLRIDNGTHVMHLERNRRSLYESVNAFIRATEDSEPMR
jgi:pimeloyl-ACP methyl ester carboxylesterase